jgi:8-oxo-dGTP diphosphatase
MEIIPKERPVVGIGVCVMKEGKVLLGKRINSHGVDCWSFPGGHLEINETWEECAKREVLEETDLKIRDTKFAGVTNDIFSTEKKHYITLFIRADYESGELKIMEPEKCTEWKWFNWKNLPQPLFLPIYNLINQGFNPEYHNKGI